jgi:3-methylfumaryl-CoA hydratase
MMDSIPEGVRALVGVTRTRHVVVSAGEIERFAQAVGATVTRRAGTLEAPLLFCQALAFEPVSIAELPADGSPRELDVPDLPARRTVGGSSEYVIHRPVRAGETVTVKSQLKEVTSKHGKSGELFMVVVETSFTDALGRPIASELATFIKRA